MLEGPRSRMRSNGRVRDVPALPHSSNGPKETDWRKWLDACLEEYKCRC